MLLYKICTQIYTRKKCKRWLLNTAEDESRSDQTELRAKAARGGVEVPRRTKCQVLVYWTSSWENVKCQSKLDISLRHVDLKCWYVLQIALLHNKGNGGETHQTMWSLRSHRISEFKNHHHNQQGQYWSWWLKDSGSSHKPPQSWTGDDTVWHYMFVSCCHDTNWLNPNCRAASLIWIHLVVRRSTCGSRFINQAVWKGASKEPISHVFTLAFSCWNWRSYRVALFGILFPD